MTLARHAVRSIGLGLLAALGFALPAAAAPEVVIVLHPGGTGPPVVLERLAARERLSLGLLGATQGPYSVRQTLLDMTQGARISRSGYSPRAIPNLRLRQLGATWTIKRWDEMLRRASSAPAELRPGLLAEAADGAAYVGVGRTTSHVEAVLAADRNGRVAEVSLGFEDTIVERLRTMTSRLAVVALPRSETAERALDDLIADPPPLLLIIRRPPRSRTAQLLPSALLRGMPLTPPRPAGGGPSVQMHFSDPPGLLFSRTTRRTGLVTAIDVLPTALAQLGVPVPDEVRGRPIEIRGTRDAAALRRLDRRLRVVPARRYPALVAMFAMVVAAGAALVLAGRSRQALRVGGLALLWTPLVTLAAAGIAPERKGELFLMAFGPVVLALATDRFVSWPRAPAVPALGAVVAFCADLVAGSPLIVRSILGPNPRFGARFYGIGNELEAILPVLALVGLAAVLGRARRPWAFAVLMLALGVFVGAGRLGADVGGVITIGAGAAAAVLAARAVRPSRRVIALACAVPVAAIAALAAIDLISGGDAHFTSTILGADDAGDLVNVFERRTSLAFGAFLRGVMPIATVLALAGIVVVWRRRATLLAPVADRPAWGAALIGGVAAGVVGSLANDSGPTLLVFGAVMLAAALAYLSGAPALVSSSPSDTAANTTEASAGPDLP